MMVFDASAMIAYLRDENGAAFVENLLDDADVEKVAHFVNLAEVFISFAKSDDEPTAHNALAILRDAGIVERNDADASLWHDAAGLVARQRKSGHGLALGDSFCVALARRLGAEIITCDHAEFEPIQVAGLADVTFIR